MYTSRAYTLGHELVARDLIKAGANIEAQMNTCHRALMLSAQNGHELVARALLENEANVNQANNNGSTVLTLSCQNGHELVALIENGAADDALDNEQWTALMYSAHNGHELVSRTLFEAGTRKDTKTMAGFSVLSLAQKNGHASC